MKKTQEFKDKVFLKVTNEIAELSHCVKTHVGAVAVIDNRIVITGINGTPPGHDNCDEVHDPETFDHAAHRLWADANEIHAEQNVINFAAKHHICLDGATLYVNLEPCIQCRKNLTTAGVVRIVYAKPYDRVTEEDRTFANEFLRKSKVKIEHLPIE